MIRILICCLGGFSSSAMSRKVAKEIEEYGLQDELWIDFEPFALSYKRADEADVLMVCPHQKYAVKKFVEEHDLNIPVYVLPPRMYGAMPVKEIMQDAKDIIDGYNKTKMNPFHFPGEDNIMVVKRLKAYRNKDQE